MRGHSFRWSWQGCRARYKFKLDKFCYENIEQNYPQLVKIVEFKDLDLRFYGNVEFDYIVSKDSFEHIIDMPGMLKEMKKRLKPGGKIFSGFGPLYTSAYGDHDRRRTNFRPWGLWGKFLALIPWGHLLMESKIIQMAGRRIGEDVNSMYDLGLNKMSVSDFRKVILNSGLVIIEFRVNQSRSIGSRFCSCFKTIPILKDYFTHNIYCVLEK